MRRALSLRSELPPMVREFEMTDEDFHFLGQFAHQHTGIVFPPHKRNLIYSRLARRLRAHGFSRFRQYCELLQSEQGDDEIVQLVNAVTTNITHFFREAHHFEHLKHHLLEPFAADASRKKLRIWSAGCSSGMEAYSIALTLHETLPHRVQHDIKILASDIDSRILEVARNGQYKAEEAAHIPAQYHSFLNRTADGLHLSPDDATRNLVAFRHLNLLADWPMQGKFDAIFCRNVAIYFDKPTRQRLLDRFADILVPGGLLYIGHSESLIGLSNRFRPIGRTVYQKVDV